MQKPQVYPDEKLSADEPDSYYFIYICTMSDDLLNKKESKLLKDLTATASKRKKKKAPAL